jgi:uroporphyrinogen-III synthase
MPAMKTLVSGMLYLVIAVSSISAQAFSPRIDAAAARLAKAHIFAIGE